MTNKEAYYFIGHLLAIDFVDGRCNEVVQQIESGFVDWEKVVLQGSQQLILPAIYVKLRDNELLPLLPPELVEHLVLIHRLNTERNEKMTMQATRIAEALTALDIQPIFLKGNANVFDNLYTDPAERMMLDIDLLVDPTVIEQAAQCLLSEGYDTYKGVMFYGNSTKHYPRLTKPDELMDVEIHFSPVSQKRSNSANFETIFAGHRKAQGSFACLVPGDKEKLMINFLHAQFENGGYRNYRSSLRNMYDALLLSKRVDLNQFVSETTYPRELRTYLGCIKEVFGLADDFFALPPNEVRTFMTIHNLLLNYTIFRKIEARFVELRAVIERPALILHRIKKIRGKL